MFEYPNFNISIDIHQINRHLIYNEYKKYLSKNVGGSN